MAKTQSEQLKGGQHVAQEAARQGHDGSRKQVSNNATRRVQPDIRTSSLYLRLSPARGFGQHLPLGMFSCCSAIHEGRQYVHSILRGQPGGEHTVWPAEFPQ